MIQLKQLETALNDGRLDEAFELLRDRETRASRRGQELLTRVAEALVQRSRAHLQADRLAQAIADAHKATQLAGNRADVAGLHIDLAKATDERHARQNASADRVDVLKSWIDRGQLTRAEEALASMQDDASKRKLQRAIDAQRCMLSRTLTCVQQAMDRDDVTSAVTALAETCRQLPVHDELREAIATVSATATTRAQAWLDEGRLGAAESLVREAMTLAPMNLTLRELAETMQQIRHAAHAMQRGRFTDAMRTLRRCAAMLPNATWLSDAATLAQSAAAATDAIHSTPLAAWMMNAGELTTTCSQTNDAIATAKRIDTWDATDTDEPIATTLADRFMLKADGVGSFLILRNETITIGPITSATDVDVALAIDPTTPTATLRRADDDYFVQCDAGIDVNGRTANEHLLADGDHITLSRRCRWRFRRTTPASATAILELSGAAMPDRDARTIVLLADSLILGPAGAAHIRTSALAQQAVMFVRDGRLLLRSDEAIAVNDRPMDLERGIRVGDYVKIGSLTMTMSPA